MKPIGWFLPGMCSALLLSGCGGGGADTLKAPYGELAVLEMDTPDGAVRMDVYPWEEADGRSANDVLQRAAKKPPKGERIEDVSNPADAEKFVDAGAMVIRTLKGGGERASILLVCDYDGDGVYLRTIDMYGPAAQLTREAEAFKEWQEIADARCNQSPKRVAQAAVRQAITTKPGRGSGAKAVKHVLSVSSDGRSGDFVTLDHSVYALMKDGWAYRNPDVPLDDLDVKRARALQPGKWMRWRKKGKNWQVQRERDGKMQWVNIKGRVTPVKRQKASRRIDGTFEYVRTSGTMLYGSSSTWYDYTLSKDRTWSSGTSTFGGTNDPFSIGMGSTAYASSCDESGGSRTFTALSSVMTYGSTKGVDGCGDASAGTYKIKGYTIELTAKNGLVTRRPFYVHGKRKATDIVVGTRAYWRDSDDED